MYSINHVNGCPKLFNAGMKWSMCEKDHMFAGKGCEICSPWQVAVTLPGDIYSTILVLYSTETYEILIFLITLRNSLVNIVIGC